jgi:hypothetical protein
MAKDKDPILDIKFFELLYPMIHPTVSAEVANHARDNDMIRHRLYGAGKLLEAAISESKGLERHDTEGRDFVDGSDAKTASVRLMSRGRSYSAPIRDIYNKRGLLRAVVYERILDIFYYFLIPHDAYKHVPKTSNIEIPFELDGTPRKLPGNNTIINWWDFEVGDYNGILSDVSATFINYKEERIARNLEQERLKSEKKRLRQEKIEAAIIRQSNRLNTFSLMPGLDLLAKNHPNSQISIPYMEALGLQQTRDPSETQPIYPSVIS